MEPSYHYIVGLQQPAYGDDGRPTSLVNVCLAKSSLPRREMRLITIQRHRSGTTRSSTVRFSSMYAPIVFSFRVMQLLVFV
jgi:hypothetical protein